MTCYECGTQKEYSYQWCKRFSNRTTPYRCGKCQRKYYSGENSPHWIDGRKFAVRPVEWNEQLREKIRNKDGFVCQICGQNYTKRRMPVHHIDYDKRNLNENNLISLCVPCHGKTNHRRQYWEEILSAKRQPKET